MQLLLQIKSIENKGLQGNLHQQAEKLATEARRLAAVPVTVPDKFEEMGRFHRDSLVVMGEALETDTIRMTLAQGGYDPDSMRPGMRKYVKFCRSWQMGQFNEWKKNRLERLNTSIGNKPPENIADEARRGYGEILPAREGRSPRSNTCDLSHDADSRPRAGVTRLRRMAPANRLLGRLRHWHVVHSFKRHHRHQLSSTIRRHDPVGRASKVREGGLVNEHIGVRLRRAAFQLPAVAGVSLLLLTMSAVMFPSETRRGFVEGSRSLVFLSVSALTLAITGLGVVAFIIGMATKAVWMMVAGAGPAWVEPG